MSVNFKGFLGPQLTRRSSRFTQGQGWQLEQEYQGTFAAIAGKENLKFDGWDLEFGRRGPYHTVRATANLPGFGGERELTERWSVHKELVEKDIFSHPAVAADQKTWNDSVAVSTGEAPPWKRFVELFAEGQLTKEGFDQFLPTARLNPSFIPLAVELSRGITGYETEYVVLERTQKISPQYDLKMDIGANSVIYRTVDLQTVFGVPNGILFNLPNSADYVDPPQGAWGWRLRDQSVEYQGPLLAVRQQDWAFAWWSTYLNTLFVP